MRVPIMDSHLKVFITDDDRFFRESIELVINAEEDMLVVGHANNGIEALEKIQETKPNIVLMDIKMPKMNGITCIKELKSTFPDMIIIILTTFNEEEFIIEGLAHGANGYVIKGFDFHLLIQTMRDLMKGQYLLPVEVATKLANYLFQQLKKEEKTVLPEFHYSNNTFTKKEHDIIKLLAKRYSNREMAKELFISEGTLRNYLIVIYEKLGVHNRSEAIAILHKPQA